MPGQTKRVATRAVAVIMGGGAGTRLYPLTKDRAKPAVPLGGKYRLVDIPISNCLNSNLRQIYLLTQFNSSSLHRHVQQTYHFDHFSRGFVEILAAQQTPDEHAGWYQGTADAVRRNLHHFANVPHDVVVILSGDQLYRMDLKELIDDHVGSGADLTVSTIVVDREAAKGFGIMQTDTSGRIVRFVEKPKDDAVLDSMKMPGVEPGRYLASMGIYVFNRSVLASALDNDKMDFGKDIIPALIAERPVNAFVYEGYWEDIGTIKSFFLANLDLCQPLPHFNFYDMTAPIYSRPRFLPGSKVESCELDRVNMCDGCIVRGAKITNALIGIRSIIGTGVSMENVVMMGADYYEGQRPGKGGVPPLGVGDGTRIRNAIVDKNARIGRNCVITPEGKPDHVDGDNFYLRDGVIVVPKGAVVPDNTWL
jgi:glucose-1-phosphate adenylyltransferase